MDRNEPIGRRPHSFLTSTPLQALANNKIYFLSLYTHLFWTFHLNGRPLCGLLCLASLLSLMFSGFLHILACQSFILLIAQEYSIPWMHYILFIHPQEMGVRVISIFWLLWVILLQILMYECLCGWLFRSPGHLTRRGITKSWDNPMSDCFPKCLPILHSYQHRPKVQIPSLLCLHLLLNDSQLGGGKVASSCGFELQFLDH